jgi:hypothetical protein
MVPSVLTITTDEFGLQFDKRAARVAKPHMRHLEPGSRSERPRIFRDGRCKTDRSRLTGASLTGAGEAMIHAAMARTKLRRLAAAAAGRTRTSQGIGGHSRPLADSF